jgi:hypothetical protein
MQFLVKGIEPIQVRDLALQRQQQEQQQRTIIKETVFLRVRSRPPVPVRGMHVCRLLYRNLCKNMYQQARSSFSWSALLISVDFKQFRAWYRAIGWLAAIAGFISNVLCSMSISTIQQIQTSFTNSARNRAC